ncbi:MAG: phage baseplate protein, partial [Fusobacteriaceae bacterium]
IHPVVDSDDLFKTINKTGGVYKTKLSLNQMPKHDHDVGGLTDTRWGFSPSIQQAGEQFKSGKGGMLWRLKTNKVGGNEDLSILPKYITKYIWERVA